MFDLEIEIESYNILRLDRNKHGAWVACYVKNDLSFTKRIILHITSKLFL